MGAKGSVPSALESRGGYDSSVPDSPKFTSGDYVSSSSRGYVQKTDRLYPDVSDYSSIDRCQYIEPHNTYIGRDLPSESAGRYTDSASLGHKHQVMQDVFFIFIFFGVSFVYCCLLSRLHLILFSFL